MTFLCIWEGICAKTMIDVCAVCSAVMLLLLWISRGWIKRESVCSFFFKLPCSLLLCDLQGGVPLGDKSSGVSTHPSACKDRFLKLGDLWLRVCVMGSHLEENLVQ